MTLRTDNDRSSSARQGHGFTLMELILVMALLVVVMGLVVVCGMLILVRAPVTVVGPAYTAFDVGLAVLGAISLFVLVMRLAATPRQLRVQ